MDLNKATEDIRAFLLEAGAHALKIQKDIDRQYKRGYEAVTQADLDISKMAADKLSHWFDQEGHILIDEESVDQIAGPEEVFSSTKYQWVLDPVDGTAGYALGRDRWGVCLGVLEDGVPIAGGFYMPATGALVVVEDDGQAYITDVRTNEKSQMPKAEQMEINSQVFVESFYGFDGYLGAGDANNRAWINTPEAGVQGGYSTLMNQAAGMCFVEGFSLWDLAGIGAIARITGFKFMSMDDGQVMERFSADQLRDNWKLNSKWILSHPDNFEAIRGALTGN